VDLPAIARSEPDHLFSNPGAFERPEGRLLNERSLDSALFDIRDLADTEAPRPKPRRTRIQGSQQGSGLIDVAQLLANDDELSPTPVPFVTASPGSLLAEIKARRSTPPPVRPATVDKTQTRLLIGCILALLCMTILLATKALA
jgi:hypothetical protein